MSKSIDIKRKNRTVGVEMVKYFDFRKLRNRITYKLPDMSYGEFLYYKNNAPKYILNWNENYPNPMIEHLEQLISDRKLDRQKLLDKIVQTIDFKLTSDLPFFTTFHTSEFTEIEVEELSIADLWKSICSQKKKRIIRYSR